MYVFSMTERATRNLTPVAQALPGVPARDCECIDRIVCVTARHFMLMLSPLVGSPDTRVRFAVWDLDARECRLLDLTHYNWQGREFEMAKGPGCGEGLVVSLCPAPYIGCNYTLAYHRIDLATGRVVAQFKKRLASEFPRINFIDSTNCTIALTNDPLFGFATLKLLQYKNNTWETKKIRPKTQMMPTCLFNIGKTYLLEATAGKPDLKIISLDGRTRTKMRNSHYSWTDNQLPIEKAFALSNARCVVQHHAADSVGNRVEIWAVPPRDQPLFRFRSGYYLMDGRDKWLLLYRKKQELCLWDIDARKMVGRYRLPQLECSEGRVLWRAQILPGGKPGFVYTVDRRVDGCEAGSEVVRFKADSVQIADEGELSFGEWNLRGLVETLRLPPQAALPFYIPWGANRLKCTLYRLFEQYPVAMQVGLYDWVMQEPERLTPAVVELMFNNLDNVILLKFPYSLATLAIEEEIGDVATFRTILVEGLRTSARLPMKDKMFVVFKMTIKEAKRKRWITEAEYIEIKRVAERQNTFDSEEWQRIEREIRELKAQVRVNRMNIATLAASIDELKAAMAGKRNRSIAFRVLRAGLALISAGIGGLIADGIYDGVTGLVNLGDVTSLGARILGVTPEQLQQVVVDMQGAVDLGIDPDEYFHREVGSLIREGVKDWMKDEMNPGETEAQVEAWAHEALIMMGAPLKEPQKIPEIPLEALRAYAERVMGQRYQFEEEEEEEEMIVSCTVVPEGHEPPDLRHLGELLGNCLRDGRVEVEAEVLRARPKRQVRAILQVLAPANVDSKAEANQCIVA